MLRTLVLFMFILGLQNISAAQDATPPEALVLTLQERDQLALKLEPPSLSASTEEAWSYHGENEVWVRNVTQPTLLPVLPNPDKATGAAVLVIPGGGFQFISIANEGYPVADWLADRGIAAFVLKYRTMRVPADQTDFDAHMRQIWSGNATVDYASGVRLASEDAQTALQIIEANAETWGIDTERLGVIGFSAGAITSMEVLVNAADEHAPDFIGYIYGPMNEVDLPKTPPPLFAALAADDQLFGKQGFGLVEAWIDTNSSVELHYYSAGGHGFAAHKRGATSDMWFDQFIDWMEAQGFLTPSSRGN